MTDCTETRYGNPNCPCLACSVNSSLGRDAYVCANTVTVFDFVRSRGWEHLGHGYWARKNGHPMSNCLPIKDVLDAILKEDLQ